MEKLLLLLLLGAASGGIEAGRRVARHHDNVGGPSLCPLGWDKHGNSCYYTSKYKTTWMEARENCIKIREGSELASINSQDTQDYFTSKMYWQLWIGLRNTTGIWEWSDGSTLGYTRWQAGEPNNEDNEQCTDIFMSGTDRKHDSGTWYSTSCSEIRRFVCKLYTAYQCPEGWDLFHGTCYMFPHTKETWDNARRHCKTIHQDSDLGSINSEEEMQYVVGQIYSRFWIGLNSLENSNVFEWSDGSPLVFASWKNGEPNNLETERCGETASDGQWWNHKCDSYRHFTCRIQINNSPEVQPPRTTEPSVPVHVPVQVPVRVPVITEATTRPPPVVLENSGYVQCPAIKPKPGITTRCYRVLTQDIVSCNDPADPGVEVEYGCDEFYEHVGGWPSVYSKCTTDGTWYPEITFRCIPTCGKRNTQSLSISFVHGGEPSKRGEWPWHAALYTRNSFGQWKYNCGATLISDRALITAAHCVTPNATTKVAMIAEDMVVGLGKISSVFAIENDAVQFKEPQLLIPHAEYNPITFENDLAIIILKSPVTITLSVRPACYPFKSDEQDPEAGDIGVVVGWGLTESGREADELRKAELPVVDKQMCTRSLHKLESASVKSIYCAGFNNGTNVCQGDSGGGMVFPDQSAKGPIYFLKGVVSFGIPQEGKYECDPTKYSYFTRVSKFSRWILRVLSRWH